MRRATGTRARSADRRARKDAEVILAIDPGLGTLGYAVVRPRTARVLELGTLTSSPAEGVIESTDRARRAVRQAGTLLEIARRHSCTMIAAEAMSFGGPPKARHAMAIALCLSWGAIAGLATSLNVDLLEIPPKMWQHAIIPGVAKINYDTVFSALSAFVSNQTMALNAIPMSERNHALDAVGVGVFAALVPIAKSTTIRIAGVA
jgi:Holliday junction resolvasome RuvABC endonuclease subunit